MGTGRSYDINYNYRSVVNSMLCHTQIDGSLQRRGWEWPKTELLTQVKVKVKSLSPVRLPWTVAYQAPPSMGFSRQEYWSGLPFPSPGDLSDPGIESRSPAFQADALTSEPPGKLTLPTFYLGIYSPHPPIHILRAIFTQ